jgi:hypothetical protein
MARPHSARAIRLARGAVVAAAVIHAASLVHRLDGPLLSPFTLGLLAFSLVPYLGCLLLIRWRRNVGAGLGALVGVVALDVAVYWSVFVSPRGSTAALALLFAPLWKLVAALPLGALLGTAVDAAVARRSLDKPPVDPGRGLDA